MAAKTRVFCKRKYSQIFSLLVFAAFLSSLQLGCTRKEKAELGSPENPIKMFFVPSVDIKVIEDNSAEIKKYLEEVTPYKFKISVPASYIAVVEAFGTKRADIAALNTFGYLLANEKYGAEAGLTVIRYGENTYKAQFIALKSGPIQKLDDLTGKKVAFVDPASTSGYLLPLKILKDRKIEPKETMFAMRHDSVVSMVYQGQVDAGATFYSPPSAEGDIQDARRFVKTQYPDVEEKVQILELTDSIPNDPIVFRKDLPPQMKREIQRALMEFVKTEKGRASLESIFGITDLVSATDEDYEPVRELLRALGKSAQELMKEK